MPAALVILLLFGLGKPLRSLLYRTSASTQRSIRNAYSSLSLFAKSVPRAVSIAREYEILLKERDQSDRIVIALEQMKEENDALRQALSLQSNVSFEHIVAEPVGREIANDVLIVNKGTLQGIKTGMPVITPSLALVGRVIDTEAAVSRVMLLSHPDSSLDGSIPNKNIYGVLKGQDSATLLLDLIPRESTIEEGDTVITNRFSSSIPTSLILGTVRRIIKNDATPFAKALLNPAYGSARVDAPVFILRITPKAP